jgi:hypothetical protein
MGAEAAPGQRADLFVQKVRQCATVLDFSNPFLDVDEKEVKRVTLKELSAFVTAPAIRSDAFTDPATYAEVFRMVLRFLTPTPLILTAPPPYPTPHPNLLSWECIIFISFLFYK